MNPNDITGIDKTHRESISTLGGTQNHSSEEQVIFLFDGKQESIDIALLEDSQLIKNILSQCHNRQMTIQLPLPKWVSREVFLIFQEYLLKRSLSSWSMITIPISDTTLQRLLWMGDYLQMEDFLYKFITEVLIPRLNVNTCLFFLNESFKKLKTCSESSEIWYMLLNSGMNVAERNLLSIYKDDLQNLLSVNSKILDQIIERAIRYFQRQSCIQTEDIIEVILVLYKVQNINQLLSLKRQNILSQTTNYKKHPSISWKLHNINSISSKETNIFKFNEHHWKLLAKMEVSNNNKSLKIYLQLIENQQNTQRTVYSQLEKQSPQQHNQPEDHNYVSRSSSSSSSSSYPGQITIMYFLVRLCKKDDPQILKNNQEIQIKHIVSGSSQVIVLWEFTYEQLQSFGSSNLDFTVYLATDVISSFILNSFSEILPSLNSLADFSTFSKEDILALFQAQNINSISQEQAFTLIFSLQDKFSQFELNEMFEAINYSLLKISRSMLTGGSSSTLYSPEKKYLPTYQKSLVIPLNCNSHKRQNGGCEIARISIQDNSLLNSHQSQQNRYNQSFKYQDEFFNNNINDKTQAQVLDQNQIPIIDRIYKINSIPQSITNNSYLYNRKYSNRNLPFFCSSLHGNIVEYQQQAPANQIDNRKGTNYYDFEGQQPKRDSQNTSLANPHLNFQTQDIVNSKQNNKTDSIIRDANCHNTIFQNTLNTLNTQCSKGSLLRPSNTAYINRQQFNAKLALVEQKQELYFRKGIQKKIPVNVNNSLISERENRKMQIITSIDLNNYILNNEILNNNIEQQQQLY